MTRRLGINELIGAGVGTRWLPTARGFKNYVSGMYWWPYPTEKYPRMPWKRQTPFWRHVVRRARICVRPTNALLAESTDGTLTDSWVDGRGHVDVNRPPDQRTPMDRPPDRVGTRAPSVRLTSRHARDTTRPIAKVTNESHLTALNGTNSRPKQSL